MIARLLLIASLFAFVSLRCEADGAGTAYSIRGRLPAPGGDWDYAVIDPQTSRLYLAQSSVTAVDLNTLTVFPRFLSSRMAHGLALLGDGRVAVDDSESNAIIVFDGVTGKLLSTISISDNGRVGGLHALDALVLDERSRLLIAINGESGLLLLVDPQESRVVGSISVGGHPEFAVANGTGKVFVNVNRGKSSELVTVDLESRAVTNHIGLDGCKEATGLAFDEADQLVMSVCTNGILKIIDERAHTVVADVAVGRGADAVMFDSKRRRAFIASADSATLSVIAVRGAKDVALVQTLPIPKGTRLGVVDLNTGRVYLPSARFGPPRAPSPYPAVVPGSFEFLIVASN